MVAAKAGSAARGMAYGWMAVALCAGWAGCSSPEAARWTDALPAVDARSMPLFRGGSGAGMTWRELVDAAAAADAVIIGETHWQPEGQAFEAALFDDVLAAAPAAAGALEFLARDRQGAVDEFLKGRLTRAELAHAVDPKNKDHSPGHWSILERSKIAGRPVIAANSPIRFTRLARTEGYGSLNALPEAERRLFRVPDEMPTGPYRDRFFATMTGHDETAEPAAEVSAEETERIGAMFRAQSLWDWTMADSVVRGLDAGVRPVVLVVGRFHVEREGGLVQALRRLRPGLRLLTVTLSTEVGTPPAGAGLGSANLGSADLGLADVVVPLPEAPEPISGTGRSP